MKNDSDFRLMETCQRIRNAPELQPFRDWIDAELSKTADAVIECNDDRMTAVLQGKARQLKALKRMVDESGHDLARLGSRS